MNSLTNLTDESMDEGGNSPSRYLGPPAHPDELGTLGRYRVLKQLGAGGMGAVFLGYDSSLDRKVALKVMLPKHAANSTSKERFIREARAAAKVKSDHVVNLYEVSEANGVPFIAMEYLQGQPLDEFLKTHQSPTLAQILRIAREVATGLGEAHELGLVHRDIKPANLWMEAPKGRIKILDFGLARLQTEDVQLTQSGMVVGTPSYMAPEQALGKKLDGRSDLYSLGVLLYRLCTGRLPFEGNNPMEVLTKSAIQEATSVIDINPSVPPQLAQLVHTLLAKNPEHRYANAHQVIQTLDVIESKLSGAGVRAASLFQVNAQEESVFAHLEGTISHDRLPSPAKDATVDVKVPKSKRKQSPLLLISLAVGIGIVCGSALLMFNYFRPKPVPPTPEKEVVVVPPQKTIPPQKDVIEPLKKGTSLTDVQVLTSLDWEWSDPENLGPNVNSATHEYSPAITADGLYLVFTSLRDQRYALYESRRNKTSEEFSNAKKLNLMANFGFIGQPWMTPDGLTLWFSGGLLGISEKNDLWTCNRPDRDSDWGRPFRLSNNVNSLSNEDSPALTPDRLTLYFSSDRNGTHDIWRSRRKSLLDEWEAAELFAPELVGRTAARCPRPLSDGKSVVVTRRENPNSSNIQWVLISPTNPKSWTATVIHTFAQMTIQDPVFSEDGTTVYMGADIPGTLGKTDIYVMRRVPKIKFGAQAERESATALAPFANLTLTLANKSVVTINKGEALPKEDFVVTKIYFGSGNYSKQFVQEVFLPSLAKLSALDEILDNNFHVKTTDADLSKIAKMTSSKTLTRLTLAFNLNPESLRELSNFPKLTRLACYGRSIDDELLIQLANDRPTLTELGLHDIRTVPTVKGWEAITRLPLTYLSLTGIQQLEPSVGKLLAGMPKLGSVSLRTAKFNEAVLREIAQSKSIYMLLLFGSSTTDEGLYALRELKSLREVDLKQTQVTADGITKFRSSRADVKVLWEEPMKK